MDNKILVLDLETTGFVPPKAKVVEIGIVELDLITGEKKILLDRLINPNLSREELVNSWIVKNGYISVEDILNADPYNLELQDKIQDIFDKYLLGTTAFNNDFDFRFMDYWGFAYRKLPCPMKLATPICQLPGRYRGYKYPTVEEAYKHFFPDVQYTELHRGADDAFHEADIVKALYDLGIFKT